MCWEYLDLVRVYTKPKVSTAHFQCCAALPAQGIMAHTIATGRAPASKSALLLLCTVEQHTTDIPAEHP